jgi:nitroreductase
MSETLSQTLLQSLNWRYATKKFDPARKISDADWNTLAESLRLSPSSYGLQPWKFILVRDPKLREELRAVAWNQSQVTDASHFVVLTYHKSLGEGAIDKHLNRVSEVSGAPIAGLKGYRDMMLGDLVKGPRSQVIDAWSQRQVYIAMGFLMEAAALLKIDTCAMEGFDPSAFDRILKLEGTGYAAVAAVALGYRHADDGNAKMKKVRFELKDILEVR